MIKNIVLYDMHCLNNILPYTKDLLNNKNIKLIISQQLYDELKIINCNLCEKILEMKKTKRLSIHDMQILSEEHNTYKSLINGMNNIHHGKCESAAISIAIHNHGFILTDNKQNIINKMGNYTLKWITINDLLN